MSIEAGWSVRYASRTVVTLCFSPDGERLVTASADGTARMWVAATGASFGLVLVHHGAVNSACFSPDGKSVVTASDDGTARLWAIPTVGQDQIAAAADLAEAVGRLTVDDRGSMLPIDGRERIIDRLRSWARSAAGQDNGDFDRILQEVFSPSLPVGEQAHRG